jgi:hypothetical protein
MIVSQKTTKKLQVAVAKEKKEKLLDSNRLSLKKGKEKDKEQVRVKAPITMLVLKLLIWEKY